MTGTGPYGLQKWSVYGARARALARCVFNLLSFDACLSPPLFAYTPLIIILFYRHHLNIQDIALDRHYTHILKLYKINSFLWIA